MFKTVQVAGTYINSAVAIYTFSDFVKYIRDNFDLWGKSPVIWDLTQSLLSRESEPHEIINSLLEKIKDLAERRTGARTAFVVTQDYEYGMFRMLCAFTVINEFPFELKVFRNFADAQVWVKDK